MFSRIIRLLKRSPPKAADEEGVSDLGLLESSEKKTVDTVHHEENTNEQVEQRIFSCEAKIDDIEEQIEGIHKIIDELVYEINIAFMDSAEVNSLAEKIDFLEQQVNELEKLMFRAQYLIEGLAVRVFTLEQVSGPKTVVIRRSETEEVKNRILDVLLDGRPRSMSELQKEVNVSSRKFYDSFNKLLREGKVKKKKEGNKVIVTLSNNLLAIKKRET
ncbi:hypothetical protein APY94_03795 [Thermococcus celericrescens]|uniref:Uncharacterized protein n=1 Tax=Thermococcus celericrescens TaxID=227598 RepID=A0A100XYX5_9EURY|nr:hypothetical protein [Thermococcus celericrescens]KUH34006.1 hypothetical protein APY94_03795 [Thermococcus celericrescens]